MSTGYRNEKIHNLAEDVAPAVGFGTLGFMISGPLGAIIGLAASRYFAERGKNISPPEPSEPIIARKTVEEVATVTAGAGAGFLIAGPPGAVIGATLGEVFSRNIESMNR